jgi:hypothetical protein
MAKKESAEKAVRDIRRRTRRRFSAEEKIRIVIEGLRGEEGIASLCRRDPDFSPFAVGTGPAWSMRLIQVHVCCMYAFSVTRLDDPGWLSGEMLNRALTDTRFARLAVDWGPLEGPLTIGTYAVFVLEPLAPRMLWLPRVGAWWAVALLAMHAGLELLTTVGWWGYMMAVGLVPFLPPAWVARPFDWLAARRLARAGAVAA